MAIGYPDVLELYRTMEYLAFGDTNGILPTIPGIHHEISLHFVRYVHEVSGSLDSENPAIVPFKSNWLRSSFSPISRKITRRATGG